MKQKARLIYVLANHSGRIYVGRSYDLKRRLSEHLSGNGTAWVKHYMPGAFLQETRIETNIFDEEVLVKQFMCERGIYNVRGGSYSNINLSLEQLLALQRDIDNALGCCFKCGKILTFGHRCRKAPDLQHAVCYFCKEKGHRVEHCETAIQWLKKSKNI